MGLEEAKDRVERELFLAYTEELKPESMYFSDGDGGYEREHWVEETPRGKRLREAMEMVGEL